jgi:hypothetical protein
MDTIYGQATWTLVAGSADSATSPLPRLTNSTSRPQVAQYTESLGDLTLCVVLPSLQSALQNAVWDQRAWTYQESMLSKRLLVVTDRQMLFTCRHGYTYYEDNKVEDMPPSQIDRTGQVFGSAAASATNFEVYADAVAEYTNRQMSFLEDGLKAFSGVLSRFRTWFKGDFFSGLPSTELDQALVWYPKGDIVRRKDQSGNDLFPTWSWVGWVGQCGYLSGLALSCIRWRICDAQDSTYCTSDDFRKPSDEQKLLEFQHDWEEMGKAISQNEPRNYETYIYDSCWHEKTDPTTLYLHPVSEQFSRIAHPSLKWREDCLEFQALTCFFSISGDHAGINALLSLPCYSDRHGLCALRVYDAKDHVCGTVHVPATVSASLAHGKHEFVRLSRTHLSSDGTRYSDLRWDINDASFAPTKRPRELNGREQKEEEEEDDDNEEDEDDDNDEGNEFGVDDGCMFDVDTFDIDEPWCVFNVMLIATNEGVSRRIGLGKVHVAAFTEDQGARWRDVVLA